MDTNQVNRVRILYILKVLAEHSDEEHTLTTSNIIAYLNDEYDISAHRTTLPKEIEALNECGANIDIIEGKPNRYFWANRRFDVPEIKLLIDAVLSSKLITAEKSDILIKKLTTLTSEIQATKLKRNVVIADRIKPDNEKVLYWVNELHTAINEGLKVEFQYYEYNEIKEKVLKHKGYKYVFSPYTLAWNGDFYYVIGFSEKHDKVAKFRVDRIATLRMLKAHAVPVPEDFDMSEFIKKVFAMFSGTEETVELLCENDMMKCIVDRFGEDTPTEFYNDRYFKARVNVYVSPAFYGWVFGFAGKIKILSPINVVDKYKRMLAEAL